MILEGNKTMFKVEIEGSDLILNNAPTKMNLMLVGDTGIGKITKIE
jgi:flagellar biosynthesis GTPase FlhF